MNWGIGKLVVGLSNAYLVLLAPRAGPKTQSLWQVDCMATMLKLRCAWIWRVEQSGGMDSRGILVMSALMTATGDGRSPSPSRTRLDTAPVDWSVVIQALINVAVAEERRFNQEVIAGERQLTREVMGEVLAEVNNDLERSVRSLTVELADLKATLAEVRLAFATDREQALDLPKLPLRSGALQ